MKQKIKLIFSTKIFFTSLLPLVLWMGLIFIMSSVQKIAVTDDYVKSFAMFKTLHLIEYGILFLLWLRFFHLIKINNQYILAFLLTFIYGFSDELHQGFVSGREGKFRDALVDGLGALLTWWFIKANPKLQKLLFKK
jgi:VanZ family protein